jgi:hypothetical protein
VVYSLKDTEINVDSYNRHTLLWYFDNEQHMVAFCCGLFGLDQATNEDILRGKNSYLAPSYENNQVTLSWDLVYIVCNR